MLKKFAAALIATTLVAGPAFAQSNGNSGTMPSAPSAQTVPASPTASMPAAKPTVKDHRQNGEDGQARDKARPQACRAEHKKGAAIHQARHAKPAKAHQAGIATAAKRS